MSDVKTPWEAACPAGERIGGLLRKAGDGGEESGKKSAGRSSDLLESNDEVVRHVPRATGASLSSFLWTVRRKRRCHLDGDVVRLCNCKGDEASVVHEHGHPHGLLIPGVASADEIRGLLILASAPPESCRPDDDCGAAQPGTGFRELPRASGVRCNPVAPSILPGRSTGGRFPSRRCWGDQAPSPWL